MDSVLGSADPRVTSTRSAESLALTTAHKIRPTCSISSIHGSADPSDGCRRTATAHKSSARIATPENSIPTARTLRSSPHLIPKLRPKNRTDVVTGIVEGGRRPYSSTGRDAEWLAAWDADVDSLGDGAEPLQVAGERGIAGLQPRLEIEVLQSHGHRFQWGGPGSAEPVEGRVVLNPARGPELVYDGPGDLVAVGVPQDPGSGGLVQVADVEGPRRLVGFVSSGQPTVSESLPDGSGGTVTPCVACIHLYIEESGTKRLIALPASSSVAPTEARPLPDRIPATRR